MVKKNLKAVLVSLLITSPFIVSFFIWQPRAYSIIGVSMLPTLHNGSRVMVLEGGYTINRFDIVIINTKDHIIIKRVIGMPGEVINGTTLGQDEYWVLGDNRTNSWDSRIFGPVKRDRIIGKMLFRFW